MNNSTTPLEIDVTSVKKLLESDSDFLLIDCRNDDEYQFCQIPDSTHIPMVQIPDRIAELEEFRDKTLVVQCHHGIRSLKVTHWLRDNGFQHARSMRGGIEAWSLEIDSGVPRY